MSGRLDSHIMLCPPNLVSYVSLNILVQTWCFPALVRDIKDDQLLKSLANIWELDLFHYVFTPHLERRLPFEHTVGSSKISVHW
jgi:hypothetical protein